eukprot:1143307-Pelagomonas_calceolata.AAC.9
MQARRCRQDDAEARRCRGKTDAGKTMQMAKWGQKQCCNPKCSILSRSLFAHLVNLLVPQAVVRKGGAREGVAANSNA